MFICILTLVGCGSGAQAKSEVSDFKDFTNDKLGVVDEKWAQFEGDVERYKNGGLTKEDAAEALRQYKEELSKVSTDIYEYEFSSDIKSELKEELSKSRDTLSEAVFERAKAAGHYSRYVKNGDENSREQITKRIQESEKEFEKYMKIIEGLENDL